MSKEVSLLLVFIVATLIGYRLIKAVPSLLHTPLMSGMNALSGVTVLGCMMVLGFKLGLSPRVIGIVGIVCATVNVVAGFAVTDRMLNMFHGSKKGEGKQ